MLIRDFVEKIIRLTLSQQGSTEGLFITIERRVRALGLATDKPLRGDHQRRVPGRLEMKFQGTVEQRTLVFKLCHKNF